MYEGNKIKFLYFIISGCFLLLTILTTTNSASIKNQGSHLSGKENISQQIEKRDLQNNGNGANAEIKTLR